MVWGKILLIALGLIAALSPALAAEEYDLEWLNSTLWTTPLDLVVDGDFAYVGSSRGLIIYDITNPESPIEVSRLHLDSYRYYRLEKAGDALLWAETENPINVIDVSDPYSPVLAYQFNLGDWIGPLETMGSVAFISHSPEAAGGANFSIIDLSDPSMPNEIASYTFANELVPYEVSGDNLFAASDIDQILWCRVTEGYALDTVAVIGLDYYLPVCDLAVDLDRGLLAVAMQSYMWPFPDGGLRFVNISDPESPVVYDSVIHLVEAPGNVLLNGNFAYISEGPDCVGVIDATSPDAPEIMDTWTYDGGAFSMALRDDYLIVGDVVLSNVGPYCGSGYYSHPNFGGIRIGRIAVDGTISEVFHTGSDICPHHLAVDESMMLAIDGGSYGANVVAVDMNDPVNPVEGRPFVAQQTGFSGKVYDGLLYLYGSPGLEIVNYDNPDSLFQVSYFPTSYTERDVIVEDGTAYLADEHGVLIVDVSDPTTPSLLGHYLLSGTATAVATDANPDVIYAAWFDASDNVGLLALDVSDPAAPVLLWKHDYAIGIAHMMWRFGSYLLTWSDKDIAWFELQDSGPPVLVSTYEDNAIYDVRVLDDHKLAVLRGSYNDIVILDWTEPTALTVADSLSLNRDILSIAVSDTLLFGAECSSVNIYALTPQSPTPVDDDPVNLLPTGVTLHQNYPNPFNASTSITYELDQPGLVTLTVTNILGQEVYKTSRQSMAGQSRFEIDMGDFPTGVYLYRLEANGVTQSRKMMLLK